MDAVLVKEADRFTRYRFSTNDRCQFAGRYYGLSSEFEQGVVLTTVDDQTPKDFRAFEWREITRYVNSGAMEIEYDYFTDRNAVARLHQKRVFELHPRVIFRAHMVSEFLAAEADVHDTGDKVTRSDVSILKFMALFVAEYLEQASGDGENAINTAKEVVSPRQFRRWIKRFEEGGHDPRALEDRYQGRTAPVLVYTATELAYHRKFADTYLSVDKPTIKSCWEAMMIDHRRRVKEGLTPLRLPSLRSFQRMIKEYGDFRIEFQRSANKHRIARKYTFAGKGLSVSRPLQVVEMDEHETDLVLLLTKNRLWDLLHPEVQEKIQKNSRAWISVALDAYSRSIVGMQILYAQPDGEAAVNTLAMVARDKNDLAELAGSKTPWPQAGTPEAIHTDAGAGYVSGEFQAAVLAFTGQHAIPPSKHPHLRARVERFFRTINQRYIHMFPGQTFSNILLRDEYDSDAHKAITHDQLSALLVRLIVDCYHNTPHRSLFGLTPLEAWYWGSQNAEGAMKGIPSRRDYHEIFGMMDMRKIGNQGIQILNLFYRSERLQEIRKFSKRTNLTIRLNPQDVSRILVKDPFQPGWFEARCNIDGLENVPFSDWIETLRYIKSKFGAYALHSREHLLEGLGHVQETTTEIRLVAGVSSPYTNIKVIKAFESKEKAAFEYSKPQKVDLGDAALTAPDPAPEAAEDPFNPSGTYEPIPGVAPIVPPTKKVRRVNRKTHESQEDDANSQETATEPQESQEATPRPRAPLRVERSKRRDQ